jgi:hypothetical protein
MRVLSKWSVAAMTAFCHSGDRYLVLHMNRARAAAWRELVSRVPRT